MEPRKLSIFKNVSGFRRSLTWKLHCCKLQKWGWMCEYAHNTCKYDRICYDIKLNKKHGNISFFIYTNKISNLVWFDFLSFSSFFTPDKCNKGYMILWIPFRCTLVRLLYSKIKWSKNWYLYCLRFQLLTIHVW